jgi:group I intron endonuclease
MGYAILAQSGVYAIRNVVNGKSYVGSSISVHNRMAAHKNQLNKGCHHSVKLQRAWVKYGANSFEFSVLELVSDTAKLVEREQHYINSMNAVKAGYNISPTAFSCLGITRSEEVKAKLSRIQKAKTLQPGYKNPFEGKTHSEETRKRLSEAFTRRTPEMLKRNAESHAGIKWPEETRRRRSAQSKERGISDELRAKMIASRIKNAKKHSVETRRRISEAQIGKVMSAETREKCSKAQMGHPVSSETRAKISAAHKGRVHSQAVRDACAERARGRKQSPETVAKRMATIAANRAAKDLAA